MSVAMALPSAEEFVQIAQEATGLSDFGDSDFQEPMHRFLDSCMRDAKINAQGVQAVSGVVTKALVNRLRFEDYLRRYPEILEIRIENPLIIIGLPRVGSTKLHKLLASNRNVHAFPFWQLLNPAPFPDAEGAIIDPRITVAEQLSDQLMKTSPDFFAGYIPVANDPDEDQWLFDLTFMQYSFILTAAATSYAEWLFGQDMKHPYEYIKRLQQFMLWQNKAQEKPLILKAPTHTNHLDVLAELFPSAKFVQPHRNPIQSVNSVMNLLKAAIAPNSDADHRTEINRLYGDNTIQMATKGLDLRRTVGEERFLDIYYEEIRDDSLDVARRIHEFWGVPLDEQSEKDMIAWDADNPQHKYGKFKYTETDLRISSQEIIAKMKPYLERYFPQLLTNSR